VQKNVRLSMIRYRRTYPFFFFAFGEGHCPSLYPPLFFPEIAAMVYEKAEKVSFSLDEMFSCAIAPFKTMYYSGVSPLYLPPYRMGISFPHPGRGPPHSWSCVLVFLSVLLRKPFFSPYLAEFFTCVATSPAVM